MVQTVDRLGVHAQPTRLVVTFDEPLSPPSAQALSNYRLIRAGTRRRLTIKAAVYNPADHSVTLLPRERLQLRGTYQLTIVGTAPNGVSDPLGKLLDGAGDGRPGSNFVTQITSRNLVLGGGESRKVRAGSRTGPHTVGAPIARTHAPVRWTAYVPAGLVTSAASSPSPPATLKPSE
jgi:hypothetical protein